MQLKLTLARDDGTRDDIVVTGDGALTIAEVARAIAERVPCGAVVDASARVTLRRLASTGDSGEEWVRLPPSALVSEGRLASGATIALAEHAAVAGADAPAAVLEVRNGRQRGRSFPLPQGSWTVGRRGADVRIDDRYISGRHARLEVADDVEVVDLGSANGILVDGEYVTRVVIPVAQTLTLGATEIRIRMLPGRSRDPARALGPVLFNRSPRVEPRYAGDTFVAPSLPVPRDPPPVPWLAATAPLVLGLAMALLTGRPSALLFVLLSPVMLLGGFLTHRRRERRGLRDAVARVESAIAALEPEIDRAHAEERRALEAEAPPAAEVVEAALARSSLLWTRRPEHRSFLTIRLGTGPARSRSTIEAPQSGEALPDIRMRLDHLVARVTELAAAPIVEDLYEAGALGCAGPRDRAVPALAGILAQLVGLRSPAELVIAALVSPAWSDDLDWLKWTPHASSPHSPLGAHPHLADTAASGEALLAALEEVVGERSPRARPMRRGSIGAHPVAAQGEGNAGTGIETPVPIPAVVVVISADAPVDRGRLVALTESGPDAGVFPVWVGERAADLPAACRTLVEARPGRDATVHGVVSSVRRGERLEDVRLETIDAATAMRLGCALAPVVDAGASPTGDTDLPRAVALSELLGPELFDLPSAVEERWRENDSIADRGRATRPARRDGRLRALVGSSRGEAMSLDLRAHGPHALVGGTTGAGKSEFLQAWALGMAVEHSPERVTFLFVDYKGGSAFGDCVRLPHCVGLVTDLSPHLVRRALTSLRAELHRRERLFERKAAKELVELERRGDPEAPPALVIVIDEFAALATEMPEFVDGMIDLAQRGRSFGIHLIMATQRPAGVIRDSLRANTNLRIALRMADAADSLDVVGTDDAAGFDPSIPGRALAKMGPGRPRPFQSAYTSGWTSPSASRPEPEIAALRFGPATPWPRPPAAATAVDEARGPNDQQRLVETIFAAAKRARIAAPRRPWLDALPAVVGLEPLLTGDDAAIAFGMSDEPGQQRRSPAVFRPDVDGHIAFTGTGGSGKTVALRTLAAATSATPDGGPVHVYGLDFSAGGLRTLEALPHVGSIVPGDDGERVRRLLRRLRSEVEDRSDRYPAAGASTIVEYRRRARTAGEPRILLLVDGFPAFREEWELVTGRAAWYEVFRNVLANGRRLGIHVALTADRAASVPNAVMAVTRRRVQLRAADEDRGASGAGRDLLGADPPPGRGIVDGFETQIAVLGAEVAGSTTVDEATALRDFVAGHAAAIPAAPPIESLPSSIPAAEMPERIGECAVLGISDETLAIAGFDPTGAFLLTGPPGSGRSNALAWLVRSVRAFDPDRIFVHLGGDRSALGDDPMFARSARDPDAAAGLARELSATIRDGDGDRIAIVVERIAEFLQTPADPALVELIRLARRHGLLLIAENEVSGWTGSWPLLAEVKSARRGLLLQPDPMDGEAILRTPVPRAPRSEFPPGRGIHVETGRAMRVQVPHMLDASVVVHRNGRRGLPSRSPHR